MMEFWNLLEISRKKAQNLFFFHFFSKKISLKLNFFGKISSGKMLKIWVFFKFSRKKSKNPNFQHIFPPNSEKKPPIFSGGSFVAERREAQKYAYQLRAVSEHRGGPYSGHFVTYRRASAPNHHTWYYTSDAQVINLCKIWDFLLKNRFFILKLPKNLIFCKN